MKIWTDKMRANHARNIAKRAAQLESAIKDEDWHSANHHLDILVRITLDLEFVQHIEGMAAVWPRKPKKKAVAARDRTGSVPPDEVGGEGMAQVGL